MRRIHSVRVGELSTDILIVGVTAGLAVIVADRVADRSAKALCGERATRVLWLFRALLACAWLGGRASDWVFGDGRGVRTDGALLATAACMALVSIFARSIDPVAVAASFARAAVAGWAVGRIGCAIIMDHPGTLSSLGFRHNLGLYELVWALLLSLAAPRLLRTRGRFSIVTCMSFSALRLLLDSLRPVPMPSTRVMVMGTCLTAFVLWRKAAKNASAC